MKTFWKVRQTNGIVKQAKTVIVQKSGGRETERAGASVILLTSLQRNLLTKIKSADKENLLTESADKKEIC